MGFFDSLLMSNEKKERLLRWQKLILTNSPDRLIMTEQQLKAATQQQAENDLRIMNDCYKIVEETIKPDVFFMRLNMLLEKSLRLCSFEQYISFKGANPSEAYNEIKTKYQEAIKQFLIRYFSDTFDKAEAMKTEKGRIGKYQKFYDSLQEYYKFMDKENIDYIETKYKAYTRHLRG